MTNKTDAQTCLDPLDSILYEAMANAAHLALDYRAKNPNRDIETQVPVIFVYARARDSQFGLSDLNDEATLQDWISNALTVANVAFGGELNLFQLGDIIFLDHDDIHTMRNALVGFVYVKNAIIVSIVPGRESFGSVGSYPDTSGIYPNVPDNMITMGPGFLKPSNRPEELTHELGHVYNLLHTFQVYNGEKELVIRDTIPGKLFPNPNWHNRGDWVKDTDADCLKNDPINYPNCTYGDDYCTITNSNKQNNYTGTYEDANDDYLINHELRQRNIMSYFECRDLITSGQLDRVAQINNSYRKIQFTATEFSLIDFIEYEGTDKKMPNILAIINFPSLGDYSDMRIATHRYTTNSTGKLATILLENNIKAKVQYGSKKVNKSGLQPFGWTFSQYEFSDWKDSLDIFDVIAIQKYLGYPGSQFGQNTLPTAYKKLATDVNDDGIISELDFIKLQQLIAGSISTFQPFTQPWRFVPEFISQGNFGFANWPFDRTIHGALVPKADYTKPEYEFTINNGLNGKAGFDGVKIGNTTHTPDFTEHPGTQKINSTSDILLYADVSYKVEVGVDAPGFSALQYGIHVKNGIVENNNVTTNSTMPYLDSISFNYNSEENYMNLVWSDLSNVYDTLMLYEFVFTPTITAPSLDSFFNSRDQTIPAYIVDSTGGVISGNFTLTIMDLDTSDLRSTIENNPTGAMRMAVYPNPAMDKIYVILESEGGASQNEFSYDIRIVSPNSLVSMHKHGVMSARNETIELDVSTLPNGIWYVQVSGLDNTLTKSVVIQR